jgi:hypothetical protein
MQHNIKNILNLLQEGLEREKLVLEFWLKKTKLSRAEQQWRIQWIELAMSWIENNFTN